MKNLFISKKIILVVAPLLSLFLGFLFNEDLSTGGSKLDFYQTLPAIIDFSDFIFSNFSVYTRHFPFHYFALSFPYLVFDDVYLMRIFYLLFSLTLPVFVYFNLCKIYKVPRINILIISASLIFLPFFRSSAIWPNAHLTALIFLLIANYFYIISFQSNKFIHKFANIFFLSLSTYCVQSYVVFFVFYLLNYYKKDKSTDFLKLLIICILFSLPGFYLVLTNPREGVVGLEFSENLAYTVITNLSIIFFFLTFFFVNKNNFKFLKNYLLKLNILEIFILFFIFILFLLSYEMIDSPGGGFFYKISLFLFNNKLLFFASSFMGLVIFYILFKNEKKIFYIILLINFTAISYYTSQRYFEPLLIVSILIFQQNFLSKNIIKNLKDVLIFYTLIFGYYLVASINNIYNLSKLNT